MQTMNTIISKQFNNNKKTVLFLHGWGGSTNSFLFFQKQLDQEYNTINLDFYGFGKSKMPEKPMDTYDYALSVYELLVSLNVKKLSIVAHSFGGRIAILLSTIFDLEVESLVLVNSAGLKPKRPIKYYIMVYGYKFCKWLVKKNILPQKVLKKFGSSDYKQLTPVMKQSFIFIVNQHLNCYLKKIKAKTLIVWGKRDKTTPLYMAKTFNKNILNSELVIYKDAGHFSYLDNAGSFLSTLKIFL